MIGTKVLLRMRMAARDAHAGDLVDGARILGLFGDLAAELLIRLDGDEGLFHTYESVEFLASVHSGDFLEATAEIVDVGDTARRIRFEARKVISNLRRRDAPPSAADLLREPIVVCRATGTCITPSEMQRRPRALYVPQLPPGEPPTPDAVVTPPSTPDEGAALARTEVDVILGASIAGAERPMREVVEEARRCREAGAAVICLQVGGGAWASLAEAAGLVREATDCVVQLGRASTEAAASAPTPRVPRAVELVTLPCGSSNVGDDVAVAARPAIRDLATAMTREGIGLMLECREVGHVEEALALAAAGVLRAPLRFELVLGASGSMGATPANLRFVAGLVPSSARFTLVASGPSLLETALRIGGHVRLDRGPDDSSTHTLVSHAATYARAIGRTPVDPARARAILGTTARRQAQP